MSNQPALTHEEAVRIGVDEAFASHGYMDAGGRDRARIREAMNEIVCAEPVATLAERVSKSVTVGTLVQKIFPDLVHPDSEDANDITRDVWNEIQKYLWSEATTGARSALQRLVADRMGNGFVLCRTKAGTTPTNAVYVTDNFTLIDRDFLAPTNNRLIRLAETAAADRRMLIERRPQDARRVVRGYDVATKTAVDAGRSLLVLAADSAENRRPEPEPQDTAAEGDAES